MADLSLASRFVNAYNVLDRVLRTKFNFKNNISFSDLIRRCASLSQVIRFYEDDLINLARLRNAIIHSVSNEIVAEPHEDVVLLMEKIADIVSTPPVAVDVIKSVEVRTMQSTQRVKDFVIETHRSGFSNIPVYKSGRLIGVFRRWNFVEALGAILKTGRSVDEFITNTTLEEFLFAFPDSIHFVIASTLLSIEDALAYFNNNRKLASIIITDSGTADGKLMGIITAADIIELVKVLEGF
jgi:predicted transcriptional regulator